ncbi:MAG: AMP-binding protein [Planctomycetota bacterium]|nr:AMP-binding protein [Planctomycetota bacterium]
MAKEITAQQLIEIGLQESEADLIAHRTNFFLASLPAAECWSVISREMLSPALHFDVHLFIFNQVFADWDASAGPPPAWMPDEKLVEETNVGRFMWERGDLNFDEFHRWSVEDRPGFWSAMLQRLQIPFHVRPVEILDLSKGVESPKWLHGAKLNITDSCFVGEEDRTAIVYQREAGELSRISLGELKALTHRVANGLTDAGFERGDAIGICMPMNVESVVIYLGIIRAGCVAVSIADSFAPDAIAARNTIAKVVGIFTQDFVIRAGNRLPLYERICSANAPRAIVLETEGFGNAAGRSKLSLREGDLHWKEFLSGNTEFEPLSCNPDDPTNILFSSGTTGEPKAIPWSHSSPIRGIADAFIHHDIREGDILCWPTNLGWMMGPWLIYASLANRASMALFDGAPTGREFGEFVNHAGVTMLGVVPSLVRAWRTNDSMKGLDWQAIKAFSSTGESSNREDMLYLMHLAGYKPVIEYCGGTEIAGGYISGTVVQPASPATFSTPAIGHDFVILDENGAEADNGELFLFPPSLGLSIELLNRDHHDVYYAETPSSKDGRLLRRHGDQMERLGAGYYRAHGRVDDTMNLGGIKVSSAEIERELNQMDGVSETAAIAVAFKEGGPSALLVVVVLHAGVEREPDELKQAMRETIRRKINPLFRINEVVIVDSLPRTASNKVMRRELRARYVS